MIATARVSWFNSQKQFGFVKLADGSDAFLHMKVLKPGGYVAVPRGTTMQVRVEHHEGKQRVVEVLEVDASGAAPMPGLNRRFGGRARHGARHSQQTGRPTRLEAVSAAGAEKELA